MRLERGSGIDVDVDALDAEIPISPEHHVRLAFEADALCIHDDAVAMLVVQVDTLVLLAQLQTVA